MNKALNFHMINIKIRNLNLKSSNFRQEGRTWRYLWRNLRCQEGNRVADMDPAILAISVSDPKLEKC